MNKCQKHDLFLNNDYSPLDACQSNLRCRTLVRRNSHLCSGAVLEQNRLLCVYNKCITIFTRFLCMHKILGHAQHCCACTTLLCMHWAREPGGPGPLPFQVPGLVSGPWLGPWPSACTRVLCMHKNVVHAQESCACTRILCLKTKPCCQAGVRPAAVFFGEQVFQEI